jgi:Glycosyltransferase
VVTTPVGGLPDVIQDGRTCLTFPFGDAKALATHLRRLIESPELIMDIAVYSIAFGERVFAPDRVNESVENLSETVLLGYYYFYVKLLIVANACSPGMGREPGLARNCVSHLAGQFEVSVSYWLYQV